jgi:integrating conjugative element protein (TIGR03765 family)
MKSGRSVLLTTLSLLTLSRGYAAPLTVIYDSGDTQSLAPYLEIFGESVGAETSDAEFVPALGAADIKHLLPIRSPRLTPGVVAPRAISRPFAAPVFFVGSDPRSERWLIRHRARLARLGAVGLVVEVPDTAALHRLVTLARGLTLLPASGSDLAQHLGLEHYPVLITQEGVTQ